MIAITVALEHPIAFDNIQYLTIADGSGHYFKLPILTTAQRNALSPSDGTFIGNSTTVQIEAYMGGAWSGWATGAEHTLDSATHTDVDTITEAKGQILYYDTTGAKWKALDIDTDGKVLKVSSGLPSWQTEGGGAHEILSATHTDSLAASVVRGDVIIGNATPKWSRLAIGTTGKFLRTDGTDPSWTAIAAGDLPTAIDAVKLADGTVSNAELQYINSLSSNAQTQIDGKAATAHAIPGSHTFAGLTIGHVLRASGATAAVFAAITAGDLPTGIDAAKLANGNVSNTEFQYLDGVSSAIQTQLGNKASTSHAATHITSGSDEVDGDKLDIDWNPSNYTPATTPAQADSVDNLTAHLYGIDQALTGGGATTFVGLTDTPANYTDSGGYFVKVNAGANALEFVSSSVETHNLLSGSHSDTLTASVVRGDLMIGNSTPKWSRLAIGTSGKYPRSDGTDISWASIAAGDLPTAIDATKIADGTVTNEEFQYIGGLTSDAQTQISGKAATAHALPGSHTFSGLTIGHVLRASGTTAAAFAAIVSGDLPAASTTAKGAAELATTTETNTGTDTGRTITPDGLAGSVFGTKTVVLKVIAEDTALTTGDGKAYLAIPIELNGMDLVSIGAHVYTPSSSGLPTIQFHNVTDTADMLSTLITIDATEEDSSTATTPAVINTATDDVITADVIRVDVDVAGTGTKGLDARLGFRKP